MGHMEAIGAETCTAFQLLLFELFGEFPDKTLLSGVVIDRGMNVNVNLVYVIYQ